MANGNGTAWADKFAKTPSDYKPEERFIDRVEQAVSRAFLKVQEHKSIVSEDTLADQFHHGLLHRDSPLSASFNEIMGDIVTDPTDQESTKKLLEISAKFGQIRRAARRFGAVRTAEMTEQFDRAGNGKTGDGNAVQGHSDDVLVTLKRFKAAGISSEEVQDYLDEHARASVALTMHPTDPQSPEYAKASMNFDRVLENPDTTKDELEEAIRLLLNTPYTGVNKTAPDMVDHILNVANNIYDAADFQYDKIDAALARSGYSDIKIRTPLVDVSTWVAGDGDGNPLADVAALERMIDGSRQWIHERYLAEVDRLLENDVPAEMTSFTRNVGTLREKLETDGYTAPEVLAQELRGYAQGLHGLGEEDRATDFERFAHKVDTFGFHGVTIDIRHNSRDVNVTLSRISEATGEMKAEAFLKLDADARKDIINQWLDDPVIVGRMQALKPEDLVKDTANDDDQTAARVLGRMQLIAENPDMSNRLILAECGSAADVMAGLLVSKAAGNLTGEEDASLKIVPLTESVKELKQLPGLVDDLLDNRHYRRHVEAMGDRMEIMIAKSDTVRQDGMAAVGAQNEAIGNAVLHGHLKNVDVEVFVGGGGDTVTRGATRISENATIVAAAVGRAAMIHLEKAFGRVPTDEEVGGLVESIHLQPVTATVQGMELQKFSGVDVAEYTLKTTISRNLLSAAQVANEVLAEKVYGANEDERLHMLVAARDAEIGYAAGIEQFGKYKGIKAGGNGSIDHLFEVYAPWVSNKCAAPVLSDRPGSRGKPHPKPGMTVGEIRGEHPELLNQRAIGADRLSVHSGTGVIGYLGQDAAFKAIAENGEAQEQFGEDNLRHTLKWNPEFRKKYVDAMAEGLSMTDFKHAWRMGGNERPDTAEIQKLAERFDIDSTENSREVTLAHLEVTAFSISEFIYEAHTGKTAEQFKEETGRDFAIQDALVEISPITARTLQRKALEGAFARAVEERLNVEFNKDPNIELTQELLELTQYVYAAADGRGQIDAISRNWMKTAGLEDPDVVKTAEFPEMLEGYLKAPAPTNGVKRNAVTVRSR